MWILTLALAAAVVAFLGVSLWRGRDTLLGVAAPQCPRCEGALRALTDDLEGWGRSYEVLGCTACGHGITMVHGVRSLFAYCPRCRQLAMQTDPEEHGLVDGVPHLTVHEECHLCGHVDEVPVPGSAEQPEDRSGKVLPFPER